MGGSSATWKSEPAPPHRVASQAPDAPAHRLIGWRYSSTREAWVPRLFRGRIGPVFVDQSYDPHPGLTDLTLFEAPPAKMPVLMAHPHERDPLPRRDAAPTREVSRVLARLSDGEEPRVVVVDGRPPARGVPLPAPTDDGNVVPIKSARATG